MDSILAKDIVDRLARIEDKQDITAISMVGLHASVSDLNKRMIPVEAHVAEIQFWTKLVTKGRVAAVAIGAFALGIWDRFGDKIVGILHG